MLLPQTQLEHLTTWKDFIPSGFGGELGSALLCPMMPEEILCLAYPLKPNLGFQ